MAFEKEAIFKKVAKNVICLLWVLINTKINFLNNSITNFPRIFCLYSRWKNRRRNTGNDRVGSVQHFRFFRPVNASNGCFYTFRGCTHQWRNHPFAGYLLRQYYFIGAQFSNTVLLLHTAQHTIRCTDLRCSNAHWLWDCAKTLEMQQWVFEVTTKIAVILLFFCLFLEFDLVLLLTTFTVSVLFGVELGLLAGAIISVVLLLKPWTRPQITISHSSVSYPLKMIFWYRY